LAAIVGALDFDGTEAVQMSRGELRVEQLVAAAT
jgi:hypothetical protein